MQRSKLIGGHDLALASYAYSEAYFTTYLVDS